MRHPCVGVEVGHMGARFLVTNDLYLTSYPKLLTIMKNYLRGTTHGTEKEISNEFNC